MTQCERILKAVAMLTQNDDNGTFTRAEVKALIPGSTKFHMDNIDPTIQGMRADEPGGANKVGSRYRDCFVRESRGVYRLTDKGKSLIRELGY